MLGVAIAIALPACFCAIAQGHAAGKAFRAIAHRPSSIAAIRPLLLVSMVFMETLAIYGLVISFMAMFKLG